MNHIKNINNKYPTHYILIIVLHFSIICAFEVIYTCSVCTVKRMHGDVLLCLSSQLCNQLT